MAEAEFWANLGTLPTMIPAAIGMIAAPKKKKSQLKAKNSALLNVLYMRMEDIMVKILKMTHNVNAFGIPLPSYPPHASAIKLPKMAPRVGDVNISTMKCI